MRHLLRPYRPLPGIPAFAALCCGTLFAAACLLFTTQLAHAQAAGLTSIFTDPDPLLAAECRAGHSCQPTGIREALMVALRYDRSAKVRQKALEGLEPYVADDMRVRDSVLEAVLNDNDPAIRTAAIGLLEPVDADTSVRQVLYSVSNSDGNAKIRNVSRQVLRRVSETQ